MTTAIDGTLATVKVHLKTALSGAYRAYLMVDAYPAAKANLTF